MGGREWNGRGWVGGDLEGWLRWNGWDGLEVAFVLVEGLFCRLLQMGLSRATADNRPQVAGTDTAVGFA